MMLQQTQIFSHPFSTDAAAAVEKHTQKNPLKLLSENGKNVYDY